MKSPLVHTETSGRPQSIVSILQTSSEALPVSFIWEQAHQARHMEAVVIVNFMTIPTTKNVRESSDSTEF